MEVKFTSQAMGLTGLGRNHLIHEAAHPETPNDLKYGLEPELMCPDCGSTLLVCGAGHVTCSYAKCDFTGKLLLKRTSKEVA